VRERGRAEGGRGGWRERKGEEMERFLGEREREREREGGREGGRAHHVIHVARAVESGL
jgi:hypothetical protein